MQLGTDYKFRDDLFDANEDRSTCPIELILDPFAGVVYRYTTVRFKVNEDKVPLLQYDYEIIKTNHLSMITLRKNKKFNDTLGLVLNAMLLELEEDSSQKNEVESVKEPVKEPVAEQPHNVTPLDLGDVSDAKVGTSNIKESDTERELHEEGPTVPQRGILF